MSRADDDIRFSSVYQAEDGIRHLTVPGFQPCALPISERTLEIAAKLTFHQAVLETQLLLFRERRGVIGELASRALRTMRSEERRVGKECRSWWEPYHYKKEESMCMCRRDTHI